MCRRERNLPAVLTRVAAATATIRGIFRTVPLERSSDLRPNLNDGDGTVLRLVGNTVHEPTAVAKANLMTTPPSDAAIIVRSLRSRRSFGEIFDRHAHRIAGYLYRRDGPEARDDLLTEVFAVAFQQRSTYDPNHEATIGWLYGIATNLLRRRWRSTARERSAFSHVGASIAAPTTPDDDDTDVLIAHVEALGRAPRPSGDVAPTRRRPGGPSRDVGLGTDDLCRGSRTRSQFPSAPCVPAFIG